MSYALIFWLKDKNISVIDVEDLNSNKEEGETTRVRYTDNKVYEGKIVKKKL